MENVYNMCDGCFNAEIKSFPTQASFEEFDFLLTKKIANEKSIRMGNFITDAGKASGYHIYECLVCGQFWKLSIPDYSDRGYFLRLPK